MKTELSAGGVVYQKRRKEIEILLLKDQNGIWTFPKGLVEDGEDKIETASREISEEVGLLNTNYICELEKIQYFYRFQEDLVKKTVYYYLFRFSGEEKPTPQEKEGIQEVHWFKANEAMNIVGYRKTNQKILKEAIKKLLNQE